MMAKTAWNICFFSRRKYSASCSAVHLHSSVCLFGGFFCSRGDRYMHVYTWLHIFSDMITFGDGTEHRVHVSSLWSGVALHPLRHQSFKAGASVEVIQSIWIRVCNVHYWAIRTRGQSPAAIDRDKSDQHQLTVCSHSRCMSIYRACSKCSWGRRKGRAGYRWSAIGQWGGPQRQRVLQENSHELWRYRPYPAQSLPAADVATQYTLTTPSGYYSPTWTPMKLNE